MRNSQEDNLMQVVVRGGEAEKYCRKDCMAL